MLELILTIIVIGVALYLLNEFVPMEGRLKRLVNVLVILVVVIWVLDTLFGLGLFGRMHLSCR